MSVRVSIEHRTEYRFDRPVELGPHEVRLRPSPHAATAISAYSLTVEPYRHALTWRQDVFGNHVARLAFAKGQTTDHLRLGVGLVADLEPSNPFDFSVAAEAATWPFTYDPATAHDLAPFLATRTEAADGGAGAHGPALSRRMKAIPDGPTATVELLVALNGELAREITYTTREEPGVQSPEETLSLGVGSCRDSGWLLVTLLRELGLAARFTSGYLVQLEGGEEPGSGAPDTVDLHAWAEVYLPGAGWVGLDPTSGLLAGEGHIPLASASRPAGAAPVIGSHTEAQTTLTHAMEIDRLDGDPDPAHPYSDHQWQRILEVGETVDQALLDGDVRLTMGGEPTFVSQAAMERPEWRVEALGGDKQALATALAGALATELAPQPLLMHTQGKWYPGEPLPRWQIGVYWRTDDRPLWADPALLDSPAAPGPHDAATAERVARALTDALGLDPDRDLIDAHEPGGADPAPLAGRVLPLHRVAGESRWSSPAWNIDRELGITLLSGDGPVGARLPLSELTAHPDGTVAAPTALTVRHDDGHVRVYLPPLTDFAHGVELLEVLQDIASGLEVGVIVEGYPPPDDDRLGHFAITPDPGVIEINIHPSASWRELVHRTELIAHEAQRLGLVAEKFDHDGRHLSTGGGSHVTLGGATPQDSPLLRRPALLRSMVTYWQHHPSLSYLFGGRFVGPTSQAPRVDEARHESLYELEIAFAELDRLAEHGPPPPWQIDRLMRNLLTDLTGNTHRAEFCIDKLFNPDSASGRLGVLELRGFEMPPHPQMSVVQLLLIRALVARLWSDPYRGRLIRWGTRLHDDFMLPWFLERDLDRVLADLRDHGFALDPEWFEPFSAFRLPRLGAVTRDGVTLTLREAIEPWHVLGEEAAGAGTARYVDSSLQRIELTVENHVPGRHAVLVNGCTLALADTDEPGTAVAGIRFRAFSPPSALHPTIGVQAPLTIELVDLRAGRSLGGCRYHVTDPSGQTHDRLPVNAAEAAARRAARFEELGHTSGPLRVGPAQRSPDYPRTLDLRAVGHRRPTGGRA